MAVKRMISAEQNLEDHNAPETAIAGVFVDGTTPTMDLFLFEAFGNDASLQPSSLRSEIRTPPLAHQQFVVNYQRN
ncbi:hypothetical protein HBI49_216550 [Parastagonospora nodorum]|nr:hypothetical protein HBI49_216550 [Parastagonospora nodorum]KAH5442191.1 hypothetical protein HBI30_234610 [Parastagonospora nodorum]